MSKRSAKELAALAVREETGTAPGKANVTLVSAMFGFLGLQFIGFWDFANNALRELGHFRPEAPPNVSPVMVTVEVVAAGIIGLACVALLVYERIRIEEIKKSMRPVTIIKRRGRH